MQHTLSHEPTALLLTQANTEKGIIKKPQQLNSKQKESCY